MLRKMILSEFQNSIKIYIVKDKCKLTCGDSLEIEWAVVEKRASEVSLFFDCDALCCDPLELQQKSHLRFIAVLRIINTDSLHTLSGTLRKEQRLWR